MRLHLFYEFKWRLILFSGIIVHVIRNIKRLMDLDAQMNYLIKKAEFSSRQIEELKRKAQPLVQDAVKKKDKEDLELEKKILNLKANLDILHKRIKDDVTKALSDIREELKRLETITLEDDTLIYKKGVYLQRLLMTFMRSRILTVSQKKQIIEELKKEAQILKTDIHHLDMEAKNLRKGGPNVGVMTLMLADFSYRGNLKLMNLIRRKAIEIRAIESKLKELPKNEFMAIFSTFDHELRDIYLMGNFKNILLRRLKKLFYDIRGKYQYLNIKGLNNEFVATQRSFERVLNHIEDLSRRLTSEISGKSKKFERMEEKEKRKLEEAAKKQHTQNLSLYQEVFKVKKTIGATQEKQGAKVIKFPTKSNQNKPNQGYTYKKASSF